MTHTFSVTALIPDSRRLEVALPPDVPSGEADIVVVVVPKRSRARSTGMDLLASEVFGMWADRTDIGDSAEYAQALRERAWRRA